MIQTLALIVVVALVALLVYAALRPAQFRFERSVLVNASPERAFALVSDLKAFNLWNPWLKKDPATVGTYGATTSGVGGHYSWQSKLIGTGSMTVAEVEPLRVVYKLDFLKPFEAHNLAEFTVAPEGNGTRVTWSMSGHNNFTSKLMQIFISMDKMVGPDFETGLADLKTLAEAPAS